MSAPRLLYGALKKPEKTGSSAALNKSESKFIARRNVHAFQKRVKKRAHLNYLARRLAMAANPADATDWK